MIVDRLAVVLIGQLRTWHICAPYLQRYFRTHAKSVDYYFVTWDRTPAEYKDNAYSKETVPVTSDNILPYFDAESNVVACRIVEDIAILHNYFRMAYLSKIANTLKREYELQNGFAYEQLVETRPDLYIRDFPPPADWHHCKNTDFVGGKLTCDNGHPFVPDLYFRMGGGFHNIFSNRITQFDMTYAFHQNETVNYKFGNHGYMGNFLLKNSATWAGSDYENEFVIRNPTMVGVDLDAIPAGDFYNVLGNRREK